MLEMRTMLLAVAIFLALFNVVFARGPEASVPDFVAAPEAGDFASQMVGLEVYNSDDEDLARIEDITVGKNGRVQAFIISVGEYLGLISHFVAVKPSALTIEPSKDGTLRAHMDATMDQLRSAPEYRYSGIRKACLNILRF
jgi:sporulation protein YlmC with PRC-barrel domain